MENQFFGSKLNTILLLILIILVVFVIYIMFQNKEVYFGVFDKTSYKEQVENKIETKDISGNKDDLISFSILPDSKVSKSITFKGVIKGAYFFEGNILINVLDQNNNYLYKGYASATTDWMTVGPVAFEGNIDFSILPKGPAILEIHNDNASGLPENDKFILVPIIIE